MSESVNVQYVGFEAKALAREYSFLVRGASSGTREFTLTIVNRHFVTTAYAIKTVATSARSSSTVS